MEFEPVFKVGDYISPIKNSIFCELNDIGRIISVDVHTYIVKNKERNSTGSYSISGILSNCYSFRTTRNKIMKENELMIGDWVMCPSIKEKYAKITEIYLTSEQEPKRMVALNAYGQRYCFPIESIKPIPLVADILIKNDFEMQDDNNFVYENDDESLKITFYPKNTNYTNGSYNYIDIERGCISITEKPIDYVHELQHSFRYCELEEKIII